jgi:hypothetical protein
VQQQAAVMGQTLKFRQEFLLCMIGWAVNEDKQQGDIIYGATESHCRLS